jgi:Domain of unknown function (DUF1707)/Cell wall-active antibiotics response 4TMS YvqF
MPTTPVESRSLRRIDATDRDRTVARLSEAYARDALTMRELELRMEAVYRAIDHADLTRLTSDLPSDGAPVRQSSTGLIRGARQGVNATFSSVEGVRLTVMPTLFDIRALFGSVELDLRDTAFQPGVTEISVHATLGNIELKLPAHVEVEQMGDHTFCSVSVKDKRFKDSRGWNPPEHRSIVRFTGHSFMSNIEIRREKP